MERSEEIVALGADAGRIDGDRFRSRRVQFAIDGDGLAIFEGDIILGAAAALRARLDDPLEDDPPPGGGLVDGVIIVGSEYRWVDGKIPWAVDPTLPDKHRVFDAVAHWKSKNTHLEFEQLPDANPNPDEHPNYLVFVDGGGCGSYVGMQGGRQEIRISSRCSRGNVIHEIGHAVGLWHEQGRNDREGNIEIHWDQIQPDKAFNFDQKRTTGEDVGGYDFGSIMHYGPFAFAVAELPTITVPTGELIGQRDGLSPGDVATVRSMYPAKKKWNARRGVQFRASVPAAATRRWRTYGWPSGYDVAWNVVPVQPLSDGGPQIESRIQLAARAGGTVDYYIVVQNLSPRAVTFEARYIVHGMEDPSAPELSPDQPGDAGPAPIAADPDRDLHAGRPRDAEGGRDLEVEPSDPERDLEVDPERNERDMERDG